MAKRILSSQAICFLFLFGCLNGDFACAQVFVTSQVGVFFANESIEWQAEIQGADRPTSVEWSLAWKETIIHKGKQKTSRNAPGRLVIPLDLPAVESGNQIDLTMTVKIAGADKPFQFPISIVAKNMFADRKEWLREQRIAVFDRPGNTVRAFESSWIPFANLATMEAFDPEATSVLVIGEGTDWNQRRAIGDRLESILSSGTSVIVLSPINFAQSFAIRNQWGNQLTLQIGAALPDFRNPELIAIPVSIPVSIANTQHFSITDDADGLNIFSKKDGPWSWIQIAQQPKQSGLNRAGSRLIVVGMPLIANWHETPFGQHALSNLLESLDETRE